MSDSLGKLALEYVSGRVARSEFRPETARTYRDMLTRFVRFVGPETAPNSVTRRHIERWLTITPCGPATTRARLAAVRSFFRWLTLEGHCRKDPTLTVRGPKQPRSVPRGLRPELVAKALDCADERARVMILLESHEGLRACEVAALQLADIDFYDGTVFVSNGKGGHQRLLPLSDETREAVQHYLASYPATAGPLVRSYDRPKAPLTPQAIGKLVGKILREAGIGETGHALRHTAAHQMLRNGANLRDVQTALGHATLGTTQRYLPLTGLGDLRKYIGAERYDGRKSSGAAS